MLQSKKGNMIISLILAIGMWMFVVGQTNPEVTKTYREVPITLENTQTLADEGLAVVKSSDETVSVTITGRRSVVAKIEVTDITATADLSDAVSGDNQIRVDIRTPSEVEIRDQSPSKITVTVEERVTESKDIQVKYTGTKAGDKEPTTVAIDPATVEVTGARTAVNKVNHVDALCDIGDIQDSETSIRCRLVPVNADGNEVKNITLSQDKAVVNTLLSFKKEVDLEVNVTGINAGGYERSFEAPDKMTINGNADKLNEISSITCKDVDLSEVKKNTKIKLEPMLPSGVYPGEKSQALYLKVEVKKTKNAESEEDDNNNNTVDQVTSKVISVDTDSIEFLGLEDDMDVELAQSTIDVTVTGKASDLEGIDQRDVRLTCDLTGLSAGNNSVELTASLTDNNLEVELQPQSVEITLITE